MEERYSILVSWKLPSSASESEALDSFAYKLLTVEGGSEPNDRQGLGESHRQSKTSCSERVTGSSDSSACENGESERLAWAAGDLPGAQILGLPLVPEPVLRM